MGPPGGPEDSWKIYNDSLILNFLPKIMDNFFEDADKNIQDGDKRWISLWGKLQAGPFNTHCTAETGSEHDCRSDPQTLPPYPTVVSIEKYE